MLRRLPALLVLPALVTWGCSGGGPTSAGDAGELPEPAGAAAYREALRTEAGVEAGPRELAELAAADGARIAARMDALAARMGAGEDWRAAFEGLGADRPDGPEAVLAAYREEAEGARRFVLERGLVTLPEGPLEVTRTPDHLTARYPLTAYLGYRLAVTVGDGARLADHCRACIPPLAVHETFPGHHTAFLHQRSGAGVGEVPPELAARAAGHLKNRFFHEGWAQYAEALMLEEGYYAGSPERELGAWRNLLFRVERARIDALLHAGDLRPEEAVAALGGFVAPETAAAELRRHLEEPTLKAAYYVGLLQVLALREAARAADPAFDLRAFHDRLVRWPLPLPEAARERFGVDLGPGLPERGLALWLDTLGGL
jgi:uncharacterized protein (DUF885 family)